MTSRDVAEYAIALLIAFAAVIMGFGLVALASCGARPTLSGSGVGISVPWQDAPARRHDGGSP